MQRHPRRAYRWSGLLDSVRHHRLRVTVAMCRGHRCHKAIYVVPATGNAAAEVTAFLSA
jgi:hypothetical protein